MTNLNERVVALAKAELGVKESPAGSNKTKYGAWFGLDGKAWCGMFVSYIYAMAGAMLGRIDFLKGYAGCDAGVKFFKTTGQLVSKENVQPGDIVFFDWQQDAKTDHTGIFMRHIDENFFESIEGNTAISGSTDPREVAKHDSNGGGVMLRKREYRHVVLFAHPKALDFVAPAPVAETKAKK